MGEIIIIEKNYFLSFSIRLPDDIWMVDLDSNKLTAARIEPEIPPLPEPEATILKNHLKQVQKMLLIAFLDCTFVKMIEIFKEHTNNFITKKEVYAQNKLLRS